MIRKTLTAAVAVAALLVGVLSLNVTEADAQYCTNYVIGGTTNCHPQSVYPGVFTNMPPTVVGAYGWGHAGIHASAPAAGTGGGDAGLAHTGSESTAIAYVGAGLIAFGAVALGSRRKFFQGALD